MAIDSLLRKAEHQALSRLSVSGKVLDLGGDRRSTYRSYFKGVAEYTLVNLSEESGPDIIHDLEKPLPIANQAFDGVLIINVLEHIYAYQQLLTEAARVLRSDGTVTIVVPFLFPIHPSPNDYWRFTEQTMVRLLSEAGFTQIYVDALGGGVFASRFLMLDRLLPYPLRLIGQVVIQPLVVLCDGFFSLLSRSLKKEYCRNHYALGYCVRATKP